MTMAKTISLLLTPEHVEMITLAANMGEIHLVLRSPEDDDIVKTTGQTATDIFKMADASDRNEEDLLKQGGDQEGDDLLTALNSAPVQTQPAPQVGDMPNSKPDWTMILLQDGDASRITFVDGFVYTEPLEQATGASATQTTVPDGGDEEASDAGQGDEDTDSDNEADNLDEFDFEDDDSSVG
jgi:hypothetical protein